MLSDRSNERLYVETLVRGDLATLWERSQDPRSHQRWDLRFTSITPDGPGRFRYAVRVLPGVEVHGTGTHGGERRRTDGSATSALRFACDHPLSLLDEGSGYWRYVPTDAGVRFLTGYDYGVRWGRFGPVADRLVRPLMGWATAWSFDRLRLWIERGTTPEASLRRSLAELVARAAVVAGAGATGGPTLAAAVGLAVLLLPPLPGTPAARRCRRRPPDRRSATTPDHLDRLERP